VFADPRGLVMASGLYKRGVGLGNLLFGTAGLIAWGLRLGRLPAVGCSTCFLPTLLRSMSCVEPLQFTKEQGEKAVQQWDGGYLPSTAEQRKIRGWARH